MTDSNIDQSPQAPAKRLKDPFLDRTAFGSVAGPGSRIPRSLIHGQRVGCQLLGLWVIVAWLLSSGVAPLSPGGDVGLWIDAWGRWGLGGHWFVAIPLGGLLFWQGMRPRFVQGLVMLGGSMLLLFPAVLAHLIPGVEMGLLVLGGIALVSAAQVWPLVEHLGSKGYRDKNAV